MKRESKREKTGLLEKNKTVWNRLVLWRSREKEHKFSQFNLKYNFECTNLTVLNYLIAVLISSVEFSNWCLIAYNKYRQLMNLRKIKVICCVKFDFELLSVAAVLEDGALHTPTVMALNETRYDVVRAALISFSPLREKLERGGVKSFFERLEECKHSSAGPSRRCALTVSTFIIYLFINYNH